MAETTRDEIRGWPEDSLKAADEMWEKYGSPDETTATKLFWYDRGPWKRIEVSRIPQEHHFPSKHNDVLEQTVKCRIPVDKFDDLARFDGSVWGKRTSGELSAICDKEAMNILTLNMAYDIIQGKRTPEEAKDEFGKQSTAFMAGMDNMAPDTKMLKFEVQEYSPDLGDPYVKESMEAGIKEGVEKVEERMKKRF